MKHIGTKIIDSTPMTRAEYNTYRGWELTGNENGADEGFLVEYLDGGAANDARHKGYISWSPTEVFNSAYRPIEGLTFGMALEAMKIGQKVARTGWNGKGMFVFLVPGSKFTVSRAPLLGIYPEGTAITYRQHMDIRNVDGSISTWAPSGSDALAEDWVVLL